jgi:cob(I)alamin adenosyltransferase
MKVLMVQFLKGMETGEMHVIERLNPDFVLVRGKEIKKFTWNMNEEELKELAQTCREAFDDAVKAAHSGQWDLLILDEMMAAVTGNFVPVQAVLELIRNKPDKLEIVMTGRNAPAALVDAADYVSEIQAVKHPFEKGIPSRKGIES